MAYNADEQREIAKRAAEAASQEEKGQKSGCLIFFLVLFGLVVIVGLIAKAMGGKKIGDAVAIAILVIAVIAGIAVAGINEDKKKSAALQATKRVESIQEQRRQKMNAAFSSAKETGFIFYKTVINTTNTACLALDSSNRKFFVKDDSGFKILNYNQLVSYELCKDGNSAIAGDASGAIVGGLLFGTVGAIAGAAGSTKSVNQYCSEMYISVVDDSANRFKLPLISESVLESSQDYKIAIERAREMLSILNVIDSSNKSSTSQQTYSEKSFNTPSMHITYGSANSTNSTDDTGKSKGSGTFSAADEIKKFRSLADSGIITEEEFEAKKKQLLGL